MPPSPHARILARIKLNAAMAPNDPMRCPLYAAVGLRGIFDQWRASVGPDRGSRSIEGQEMHAEMAWFSA